MAGGGRGDEEDIGNVGGPMPWPSARGPAPTSTWRPRGQEAAGGPERGRDLASAEARAVPRRRKGNRSLVVQEEGTPKDVVRWLAQSNSDMFPSNVRITNIGNSLPPDLRDGWVQVYVGQADWKRAFHGSGE